MKRLIGILLVLSIPSCSNEDDFLVSQIIDGRSLKLSTGVVVELEGIINSTDNIPILERYCQGNIHLYDKDTELISSISSANLSAIVFNADGDCINQLLTAVHQVSKSEHPIIKDTAISSPVEKTVVKMKLQDGVYVIPAEINGLPVNLIFDTGASLIALSLKEANSLYSEGKIRQEDIIGKGNFGDASGNISEGLIILLPSVRIGNRTLEKVQACVIANQNAPLLLGQSALEKFGKISIDYKALEITFE